jgi:hypothetical protein
MTAGGNGGFIGVNAPVGTNGGSGIWSIEDAALLKANGQWPSTEHVVSGGTVTTANIGGVNYKIHTFTSPGTLTVTTVGYSVPSTMDYLVIGGGGGGVPIYDSYGLWQVGGGGGGAGGMLSGSTTLLTGSFPVTVGAAGSNASSGGNTVLTYSPAPFNAIGGGAGGISSTGGTPGGSGGGGGYTPGPTVSGGNGTPGQGFPGGSGDSPGGGGGGGAGGAGGNFPAGNPGVGSPNSITGTAVTYAVGGGGGPNTGRSSTSGSGGASGPGATAPGVNGTVIVRYRTL